MKYRPNNVFEGLESQQTCLEKFSGTFHHVFFDLQYHFPHGEKSLPTNLKPTVDFMKFNPQMFFFSELDGSR